MAFPDGVPYHGQHARRLVPAVAHANLVLTSESALRTVERQPISVLDATTAAGYDSTLRQQLAKAGRALLAGLEDVAHDDELWRSLDTSTTQVQRNDALRDHELHLRAVLDHDIPEMLLSLGYPAPPPPPPPPVDYWTTFMQEPLDRLFSAPDDRAHDLDHYLDHDVHDGPDLRRAAEARKRLVVFIHRFRTVLERFGSDTTADVPVVEPRGRRILAAAVRAARDRAVPAALAAGTSAGAALAVTAVVMPPAAPVVAPAVGLAALVAAIGGEAAKEAAKVVMEAAATEAIAGQPEALPPTTRRERLDEAAGLLEVALQQLVSGSDARGWAFLASSQVYALLDAVAEDGKFRVHFDPDFLRLAAAVKSRSYEAAQEIWFALRHNLHQLHVL